MTVPSTLPVDPDSWARLAARVAAGTDPVAVIREHQAARWAARVGVPVEEYLRRFPALGDEDALVLIAAEAGLRREWGETPTVTEYQARFPRLADDLGVQF